MRHKDKIDSRGTRSGKYQDFYHEIPLTYENLCYFSDKDESILDIKRLEILREKLMSLVRDIAKINLTEWQYTVYNSYYIEEKTQDEIAKEFDINQSSVTKALNGNKDYESKGNAKFHGGLLKKLRKHCMENNDIIYILKLINNEDIPDPQWLTDELTAQPEINLLTLEDKVINSYNSSENKNHIGITKKHVKKKTNLNKKNATWSWLDEEMCIVLRWRHSKGATLTDLSKKYNIPKATLSDLLNNKTHKKYL